MKLLYNNNPPIIGYQHHAFYLGIMGSESESPWLYSRYLQLVYSPKLSHYFDFYYEYLYSNVYLSNIICKDIVLIANLDIINLIKSYIQLGYFTYINIDEYYIPKRQSYKKRHFLHNILIIGYDETTFTVAGFSDKMMIETTTVYFEEFLDAFNNSFEKTRIDRSFIRFIKKSNYDLQKFDKKLMVRELEDFINSSDTSQWLPSADHPTENAKFGFSAYEALEINIINKMDDIRPFHILWEHKKIMNARVRFLQANGYVKKDDELQEKFIALERESLVLRNLYLKMQISGKWDNKKLIIYLNKIVEKEKEYLPILLDCLY